jgi:hypothetical protein
MLGAEGEMMPEPIIVSQSAQPQSTTPAPSHRSGTQSQYIRFFGSLTNGKSPPEEKAFEVLAGEGGATATDGYAKWARVPRPQRVAMTVLEGYEPMTMTVPVIFDAVVASRRREDIELNIQKLEWMGGRGVLFQGVGKPGQGDSPLVQIETTDSTGRGTPLVPLQFQTADLRWVVTGIAFDESPDRNHSGHRIRQKVTVTLTEHVSSPGTSFDSSTTRRRAREAVAGQYRTFVTTDAVNTIERVAVRFAHNLSATREISRANSGNRKIGSNPEKPLPRGTHVKVPLSAIHVAR